MEILGAESNRWLNQKMRFQRRRRIVKLGYVKRGDAKPGSLKEQLMTTSYNDEELKQIARLNFENWIHYNREIIELLYTWPKDPYILEEYEQNEKIQKLSKILKMGIDIGVISPRGGYHLTTEATKYYRSLLMKDKEFIGGGQERNDVNI